MTPSHVPIKQLIRGLLESSPLAEFKVDNVTIKHCGFNQFVVEADGAGNIWDDLPDAVDDFLQAARPMMDQTSVEIYS